MYTPQKASRISRIIVFSPSGYYHLYDSWTIVADELGLKKHEFYFHLDKGTPIPSTRGPLFVDIYITDAMRRRIAHEESIRTRQAATPAAPDAPLTPAAPLTHAIRKEVPAL